MAMLPSRYVRRAAAVALVLAAMAATTAVLAVTPAAHWVLHDPTPNVKDHMFRVDVDPGDTYPGSESTPVSWAQRIMFEQAEQAGYLALARYPNLRNSKKAMVQIWGAIGVKGGALPSVVCHDNGPCEKISGHFEWHVGHRYRLRMEISPRTPSDAEGNWWMFTITDYDAETKTLLGELKTPKAWGGLSQSGDAYLSYGEDGTCDTLRHSSVTMLGVLGDYGQSTELSSFKSYTYGAPHACPSDYVLTDMHHDQYGSVTLTDSRFMSGAFTFVGNTYRGLHQYGDYRHTAKAGMMFVKDLTYPIPYIYRAAHDGSYKQDFPAEGTDNWDWLSVGRGYPFINDLYQRHKRVYTWEERNEKYVTEGDIFVYSGCLDDELEYFTLEKKEEDMLLFECKSDNRNWKYAGRYPMHTDVLSAWFDPHTWSGNSSIEREAGTLYHSVEYDGDAYYILKSWPYGAFPDRRKGEVDNVWWQYVGSKF